MYLESHKTSLWVQAFDALSDDDKQDVKTAETETGPRPQEIVQAVEIKRQECVKKQWVVFTNKAGEKVLFRDILGKVVKWVERFQQVGDTAVQYDPGHAALPWMVVRALLNVAVNDVQTFGAMVESLETISSIIARYTELEAKVLIRESNLTKQLSAALVTLYGSALGFLAHALRYYGQRTIKRFLHSAISSVKSVVEEPMLRVEKHEEQVYRLVSLVQNEISGVKLDSIIEGIRQSVENSQASNEERRKRLSSWINGIDTKNTYETALQYHHSGTCEWTLEVDEFKEWQSHDSLDPKLLWLHGPAGFGKTFMSAWIIRHLEQTKTTPLAYFFCVADNQITRDPYAILRSWLMQLLDQHGDVGLAMDAVHKVRSKEQTLTYLGLWELFTAVGAGIHGCTFVIDGFDECADIDTGARYHRSDPRNLFLRDLLNNLTNTSSRVLVVSRDVPDIREYLGQNMSTAGSNVGGVKKLEYSITARDTGEDVRLFSEHMVNTKLVKKSAQLRSKISTQAAERSEGMFLWIKLLEQEISPGKNAKQLSEVVAEMPLGIGEAYSRELDKILRLPPDAKDRAVMILRWTLFAVRPLQVKQLAEALIVSDQDLDEYPEDDLPDSWNDGFVDEDYVKEMILSPCGSLLQLRSNKPDTPLSEHTVHFVHFSVKEYLSSLPTENLAGQEHSSASLGLANASNEERRLSSICLRYLTLNTFDDMPTDMSVYPFLSYAAWAWYFHSFHKKPTPSQDILDRTRRAFDPSVSSWRVWTPLMEAKMTASSDNETCSDADSGVLSDAGSEILSDTGSETAEDEGPPLTPVSSSVLTPIYYASLLGLTDVVKWLEDQGLDPESPGGHFGFPLQAAVVNGHVDVVRYLLSRKVNVLQKGGEFGAAIVAAAASSTLEVVKMLVAAGADVKVSAPETGWTALHYAARRGSVEITQHLLDSGAEVDALSATQLTAASLASRVDHQDILVLLIDKGADFNHADSHDEFGGPPLEYAIRNGNLNIVDMLLERGVLPDQLFPDGNSPLHTAIRHGRTDIAKKLLDKGADPDMTEDRENGSPPEADIEEERRQYWTPLQVASSLGKLDSIAALLDAGADVLGRTAQTISPLQAATANGHLEAAELLYQRGASLDQESEGGFTALLLAVHAGALATVKWLVDRGASMRVIWEDAQQSLFDLVADGSSPDIAELLVRHGCFRIRNIPDADTPPPLEWDDDSLVMLAYTGNADKLSQFLQTNHQDQKHLPPGYLGEAMHVASALGHIDIVKLLLSTRAAHINVRDINSRTALHHATRNLHFDLAELLIDNGANLSPLDIIGSTPIDLAITHGQRAKSFIQNNMDQLTLNLNHRPSLLASPISNKIIATDVRKSLSGTWTGYYEHLAWEKGKRDAWSIHFPAGPLAGAQPSTFSSDGKDAIGAFQIHGFVDPIGVVWFVKLYEEVGWLYRGQLGEGVGGGGGEGEGEGGNLVLKGTWGSNRKLWFGTFLLRNVGDGE